MATLMPNSEESLAAFRRLKAELHKYNLESQTEADTRARLISRILGEVLGWNPENINREENANPGFMDYVLLTSRRIAVLEAKRSGDSFILPTDISTSTTFTLNGIIRSIKNLSTHIDQVSGYCLKNGIEFAIISNGHQFVLFRAIRTDGIHIGQGKIIVFKSFDDIEQRFVDFWNLLAKSNVENNSLSLAFQATTPVIFQYKRITDELHRYRERVSRNVLSPGLEPLISEYLGEITDERSKNKLKDFFVKSPALSETLKAVEARISLHLSETVRATGVIIEPSRHDDLRKGLKRSLERYTDLPPRGQVILLLGRVGSGKTTFTSHFLRFELKELFEKHILVQIDFRLLEKGGAVSKFFYDRLHESLSRNKVFLQLTPKQLRQVYAPEIGALSKGPLAVIEKQNKKLYEEKIAEYLLQQFNNLENHYVRVLSYLAVKEKIRCVFVFDNADQHDFELQQEVFRFAHAIAGKCFALSIVTMWEETYLRSKQGGALSAYSTTAYSLHPTSVVDIINRRLEYIVKELQDGGLARDLLDQLAPADDVRDYLTLIRDSIFYHGRRVRFFLESLAMGNLRRALDLFSLFLTSGHTDASKILASHRSARGYLVPLHEFIKSIGLGDFPYYHGDLSAVLNLYSISDESRPSHLTKVRLLEYLSYHRNRSSSFGIGFVRADIICAEFDRIGTSAFDLAESLRILV
jgi:GTPase SAR1 family protein